MGDTYDQNSDYHREPTKWELTKELRFVVKDGQRLLQQKSRSNYGDTRWELVPTVTLENGDV